MEFDMAEYRSNVRFRDRCPTHPGAVLRLDVLPALGLPKREIADKLGISRQMLYGILKERHTVTPDTAARIGKLCGNGAALWLRMQQAYDLWHVEHEMSAELARIPTLTATAERSL
jgi:addiction module HigA family antidote